jgi:hypothetical protein
MGKDIAAACMGQRAAFTGGPRAWFTQCHGSGSMGHWYGTMWLTLITWMHSHVLMPLGNACRKVAVEGVM